VSIVGEEKDDSDVLMTKLKQLASLEEIRSNIDIQCEQFKVVVHAYHCNHKDERLEPVKKKAKIEVAILNKL